MRFVPVSRNLFIQVPLRARLAALDVVDGLLKVPRSDNNVVGFGRCVNDHGGLQYQHARSGSHARELGRAIEAEMLAGRAVPGVESGPYCRQVGSPGECGNAAKVIGQIGLYGLVSRPGMTDILPRLVAGAKQKASQETAAQKAGFVALCEPVRRARAKDRDAGFAKCDRLLPQDPRVDIRNVVDLREPGNCSLVVLTLQRADKSAELLQVKDPARLPAERGVQGLLAERIG